MDYTGPEPGLLGNGLSRRRLKLRRPVSGERTMNHSKMRLHRRKQVEMEQRNALLGTMVRHFENMIADLDGHIATEDRIRIKDTAHPAYSTAKRRRNLLTSVAHLKSLLEVAKRELDEVARQFRDLESMQNPSPSPAVPAGSTRSASWSPVSQRDLPRFIEDRRRASSADHDPKA